MIEGVKLKKLKVIPDERGRLMEILRVDEELFQKFGQVYMTTTSPGVIKGWHLHKIQTDNIVCLKGMIKLALYDPRQESRTKNGVNEFFIGEHNPVLIQVPKDVYHGWKCISESEAIVINCPTEAYDYEQPDEHRLSYDTDKIPYDWSIKMG
ncbi:MAG TPA: dTDP-4-dehydrorhamnose 3,5-epimerase family protein [Candidatus Subteraquimicrobiales bacterium]